VFGPKRANLLQAAVSYGRRIIYRNGQSADAVKKLRRNTRPSGANARRNLKVVSCRVFNFKLSRFAAKRGKWLPHAVPLLELKAWPKFGPPAGPNVIKLFLSVIYEFS
jgi:hypothetical protein